MAGIEDEEDILWEDDDDDDGQEEETLSESDDELAELIDLSNEYVETGEARRALKMWRDSIDRYADEPDAFFHYGNAGYVLLVEEVGEDGSIAREPELGAVARQALGSLEESLSMEPERIDCLNVIGKINVMREEHAAAVEVFNKSLALNPDQDDIEALRDIAENKL